jgi:regulator of RNase E activity RraA
MLTDEKRARLERLHTAIVNDVTDEMGIRDNVIPCTDIAPVWGRETVAGTAHTIQVVDIAYEKPMESNTTWLEALDAAGAGDVVVKAAPETDAGLWGELLSTAMQASDAVGAVIDGPTRDTRLIEEHGFPVWATGHTAIEGYGRVDDREFGVPVEIEGVTIEPGDVLLADYESIAVVPPDVLDEVLERAEADYETEDDVRAALRDGTPITEAWDEFETL